GRGHLDQPERRRARRGDQGGLGGGRGPGAVDGERLTDLHHAGGRGCDDYRGREGWERESDERGDGGALRQREREHPDATRGQHGRQRGGDRRARFHRGGDQDGVGARQRGAPHADGGGDRDAGSGFGRDVDRDRLAELDPGGEQRLQHHRDGQG